MPEGLAQTMTDQELVDLLAYLTTLRKPVSIVGQYHVIGPLIEAGGRVGHRPGSQDRPRAPPCADRSQQALLAPAECQRRGSGRPDRDWSPATHRMWFTPTRPVTSPIEQKARLVVETHGRPDRLAQRESRSSRPARTATHERAAGGRSHLPKGTSTLLIRLTRGGRPGGQATLVTTIVSAQPVSFTGGEASLSARR